MTDFKQGAAEKKQKAKAMDDVLEAEAGVIANDMVPWLCFGVVFVYNHKMCNLREFV